MICEIDYNIIERKYSIALVNDAGTECYVIQPVAIALEEGKEITVTKIPKYLAIPMFNALAKALQQDGYLPQSAVDAELKATKHHLEDMQKLTFQYLMDPN